MADDADRRLVALLGSPGAPPIDTSKAALQRLRAALKGEDDNELRDAFRGALEAVKDSDADTKA